VPSRRPPLAQRATSRYALGAQVQAAPQAHASPQPQLGPQAQTVVVTVLWQPQVQLAPGHGLQPQSLSFASFLRFSLDG
jgi:hypothetical protein